MRCYFNEVNGNQSNRDFLYEIKEPFYEVAKLFSQDILPKIKSGCIKLKRGYTKMTYLFSKKNG